MSRAALRAAWLAASLSAAAAIVSGATLAGYAHGVHPLALLGARGIDGAPAFNLAAFVVPGLLIAFVAWRLRQAMQADASWALRIGAWLAMLSALAFAAQGLLPLDPDDLEATGSRLHASAWTLWWVAFAAGALSIAVGRHRGWPGRGGPPAWAGGLAALALLALVLFGPLAMPAAIAQRAAFALWFLWWIALAAALAGRR
ncbi:DUF998 domain-containing protein [Luteimonas aquatica]|uniref:DUF998 domain-containing protein n=1 Tax=Luteimonas aquatica TaxID=450364 RepID=UPI001F56C0B3|nr:DUF998 domain-containing protein [Luteimonas aquatica]